MKRVVLIAVLLWMFLTSSMMVFTSNPVAADEPQCTDAGRPILAFGRRRNCGYFKNNYDNSGTFVRPGGLPASVNTASELITLIEDDLNSGDTHRMTGAKFIVLNMIGRPAGLPQSVTPAQLQDWKERVNDYASASEDGNSSFGPSGRIDWFVSLHPPCGLINTYYQDDEDDVAPYTFTASNSECEKSWYFTNFLVFRDTTGNIKYMIRRECLNPVGDTVNTGLDKPKAIDYNVEPSIGVEVNGDSSITTAEVGDTVRFIYQATNSGNDPSPSVSCTIYANIHSGYFPTPPTPTSGNSPPGYSPPPTSCPKVFPRGLSPIAIETITITMANQTICRSLFVSPSSQTVALRGEEVCLPVANKPYPNVFGGDVSAGNRLEVAGSCGVNTNAGIVGWNKRSPGSFAGAGAQFGVFALQTIRDFASAQGNGNAPTGLSFANTNTAVPAGEYGGAFAELPCIPDYYATKPSSTQSLPANFNSMVSDSYEASGSVTITGGVVDKNEQIAVFVDGDVFITGNITFASGTWNLSEIPSFGLIVRGNIYIHRTVTQLDGLFVAQQKISGTGGVFYSCATGFNELPLDGTLFNTCNARLAINGSVVADQLRLLRTIGSLSQSGPSDSPSSNNASELFNYGPAHWLIQPIIPSPTPDYDAIISLPPTL